MLTFTFVSLTFESPQEVFTVVTPSWPLKTGNLLLVNKEVGVNVEEHKQTNKHTLKLCGFS